MYPYLLQPSNLAIPFFFFVYLFLSISISSRTATSIPSLPLPTALVYQFPNSTWVENLAFRSNGEILVTVMTKPDLYLIDPSGQTTARATLVHSFPSAFGLLGITEVEHDVFYIIAGNLTVIPLVNAPGTYGIWEVDMRSFFDQSGAAVRKVTDIPEASFLDGAATLSKKDKTIVLGDAGLGRVWKLNVQTGAYSLLISDTVLNPLPNASFPVGIDGLRKFDDYLLFTSSNQGLVGRIPISTNGTAATGNVEILADLGTGKGLDDLTMDCEGRVWITENPVNLVSVLFSNGTVVDVVGATDQLTVAGVTACVFGRGEKIKNMLYCTTAGGLSSPVNGTVIEGGKVVVVDTQGF